MKLLGVRHLSVLLVGALLFCHTVFGSLHLLCYFRSASVALSTQRSTKLVRCMTRMDTLRITGSVMGSAPDTSLCSSPAFSGCFWDCSPRARRCGSDSGRVG